VSCVRICKHQNITPFSLAAVCLKPAMSSGCKDAADCFVFRSRALSNRLLLFHSKQAFRGFFLVPFVQTPCIVIPLFMQKFQSPLVGLRCREEIGVFWLVVRWVGLSVRSQRPLPASVTTFHLQTHCRSCAFSLSRVANNFVSLQCWDSISRAKLF
jgi:hypothetical protein